MSDAVDDLRARLAEAEKERDEAQKQVDILNAIDVPQELSDLRGVVSKMQTERDAAYQRRYIAGLEAARDALQQLVEHGWDRTMTAAYAVIDALIQQKRGEG